MTENTTIPLWPEAMSAAMPFRPYLELFLLPGKAPRGVVLVLPGGGYAGRADHEAEPVAAKYNAMGFHAAVVHYRVSPARFPAPQADAFRAIRLVRSNAARWRVKPDKIAVLGFSAGGHLAASTGALFSDPATDVMAGDAADAQPRRPDALILCYPVISSGPYGHRGSFEYLLGDDSERRDRLSEMSLEHRVTAATPPAFLWHTGDDQAVPVENSLFFALALRRCGVAFELHVYPSGPHGLGLAECDNEFVSIAGYERVAGWPALSAGWLEAMGWKAEER